MSQLMANACKEARNGNKTLKESVRHIGNKFLNATEISAQEAAYLVLQLDMSRKSRTVQFLSTSPTTDGTFLLKTRKELEELPKDSTDIEADNIIKRYMRRPKVLEDFCLADFASKVISVTKIMKSKEENSQETKPDINKEENCEYDSRDSHEISKETKPDSDKEENCENDSRDDHTIIRSGIKIKTT